MNVALERGVRLAAAEWRAHPLRQSLALAAIAIGVALGFAVQLVNGSAVASFEAATRNRLGRADLELRAVGTAAEDGIDDHALDAVFALDAVADASPVVAFESIVSKAGAAGAEDLEPQAAEIAGLDPFRAARVTPSLFAAPGAGDTRVPGARFAFVSPALLAALHAHRGDALVVRHRGREARYRIDGLLDAAAGPRLVAIDIASAQDDFGYLGRLHRIDLRLAPGIDRAAFARGWTPPPGSALADPELAVRAALDPSRAYRVNLGVLALIALLTGGFLVHSILSLSVAGRRAQFALLRALGATRRANLHQVLAEAAALGVAGSLLGLVLGTGAAAFVVRALGSDLGGGYFAERSTPLVVTAPQAIAYFAAGVSAALTGAYAPARRMAELAVAQALKPGLDAVDATTPHAPWLALVAFVLALGCATLPSAAGLPLAGYASVALLIVGGIVGVPWLAARAATAARGLALRGRSPPLVLAAAHVARSPGQAQVLLAGVLASFSLMVAMAVMVASFRASLVDWLDVVLPADLYLRQESPGATPIDAALQARIAALPGVARVEWARSLPIALDPSRAAVMLTARPLDADLSRSLPIVDGPLDVAPPAVHVSEAVADLYGVKPGAVLVLPGATPIETHVASVWRDYASQSGAIAIDLHDWQRLTGDTRITAGRIWLDPAASSARDTAGAVRDAGIDVVASTAELRTRSLAIFDRSFAITYGLEAIAIAIGIAGVAATVATQALARAPEFGVLRHLGLRRRDVLAMLVAEVALLTTVAIVAGLALGLAIGQVLIRVVNPQSFHWTLQTHLPTTLLAAVTAALLASALLTTLVAGRRAASGSAVAAVRDDA